MKLTLQLLKSTIVIFLILCHTQLYGQLPMAICQDITVSLDANGDYTLSPNLVDDGSTAPEGFQSLEVSPNVFDCDDVGNNTVTLIITDIMGDTSSCTATVLVEDNTNPSAMCATDFSIALDAMGMASITTAQINNGSSDACGIESLELSQTQFTCAQQGQIVPVTLMVTDRKFKYEHLHN